ncbi:MAG: tryptophan 7-halogenase, partial [SAR202 cluster bacterium]|nr:tryptophan 7-halogenase [SAR202 cluster bacterium]
RDTGHIDEMFPSASFQYVLYGMGFETQSSTTVRRSDREADSAAAELFRENKERTKKLLASMPTNRELIDKITTYGLQKI